jgi:predicted nucleic acid-binding protein
MAREFLDTNILVYANDDGDTAKQDIALALLASTAGRQTGAISTQTLVEYGAVAWRKLHQPLTVVDEQSAFFARSFEVVPATPELVRAALALAAGQPLNYWDALAVAAAQSAGCALLYSEDLNAGQSYAGVLVVNPFRP